MIDWTLTFNEFGYGQDILSSKRPKVVCRCDTCQKPRNIRIRDKKKLKGDQIEWVCPSCVKLKVSAIISANMKELWAQKEYRTKQQSIKATQDYKSKQSKSGKDRWCNAQYREKIQTGIDRQFYINKSKNLYGDNFDYSNTTFGGWHNKIQLTCTKCDNVLIKDPQKHLDFGFCKHCGISKGQKSLAQFISSLGHQVNINEREALDSYELDIFIPSKQLALEYHGLYWHSYNSLESKTERYRHQDKALRCISAGIKLYQVYDFEWTNKADIIQSMVKNSLSMSDKLNARSMKIVELEDRDAKEFFNSSHLLGYRTARLTLALQDEQGVAFAMSFSKVSHNDYEIIRMASRINSNVRGGASKILSYFHKTTNFNKLYTYADLRYSNGSSYQRLGFNELKITPPGYFYSRQIGKNYINLSRQQCQKNKLHKFLPNYDPALPESQNMFNHGYRRVWTAGNILFVKLKN